MFKFQMLFFRKEFIVAFKKYKTVKRITKCYLYTAKKYLHYIVTHTVNACYIATQDLRFFSIIVFTIR